MNVVASGVQNNLYVGVKASKKLTGNSFCMLGIGNVGLVVGEPLLELSSLELLRYQLLFLKDWVS